MERPERGERERERERDLSRSIITEVPDFLLKFDAERNHDPAAVFCDPLVYLCQPPLVVSSK